MKIIKIDSLYLIGMYNSEESKLFASIYEQECILKQQNQISK